MTRMFALLAGAFLWAGAGSGCCLKEKEALRPLPEEATLLFEDLLGRVRVQATTAVEAFYVDDWTELEEVAKAMEQSARFLPKTTEQPATLKDLGKAAKQLRHEAGQLAEAARAKNVEAANSALQRVTLQVRLLKTKQQTIMAAEPSLTDEPRRADVDALAGPVLVEFGASWCGHCLALRSTVTELLASFPQVHYLRIEDGKGKPLGRSFHVKLWPTFVFLRDGAIVQRAVRPAPEELRRGFEAIAS